MQPQDLQQISSLLNERFKENNKILKKEIVKEVVDEVGVITNQAFGEFEERMDKKFDRVNRELAKRPTKKEMFGWADRKIVPLEIDMDKVKYLHLDKWNKLPPTIEISRTLVENKLKKRQ